MEVEVKVVELKVFVILEVVALVFMYALFSFIEMNTEPVNWGIITRIAYAVLIIISVPINVALSGYIGDALRKNKDRRVK